MLAPQMVSVIIPYLNQGQRLLDAVTSVEAQSYPHLEILVVDDGSLGSPAAQVLGRRTARPLRILRHPMHAGQAAAKNSGAARSAGHLLVFLDADDVMAQNFVESAVSAVSAHPGTDIVHSRIRTFGGFDEELDVTVTVPGILSGEDPPRTFLCTRALHDSLSGFRSNLKFAENADYWLRVLLAGMQLLKVDAPLSLRRVGDGTRSADRDYSRRIVAELLQGHRDLYKRNLEAVLVEQKQKHLDYRALSYRLRVDTELLRQELNKRHQELSEDHARPFHSDVSAKPADGEADPAPKPSILSRWSALITSRAQTTKQSTTRSG